MARANRRTIDGRQPSADELVEPDAPIRTPLPIETTGAQALKEMYNEIFIFRMAGGRISETWGPTSRRREDDERENRGRARQNDADHGRQPYRSSPISRFLDACSACRVVCVVAFGSASHSSPRRVGSMSLRGTGSLVMDTNLGAQ